MDENKSNQTVLRGFPSEGIYIRGCEVKIISNEPWEANVNYEWIIHQIQVRLAMKNVKSMIWNDIKNCLRELDKEQRDG